jgi:hypothetical protein
MSAEDHPNDEPRAPLDDDAVRALVTRLSRPHRSGGSVVERAAILAAGADFTAVMAWIEQHGGEPEAPPVRRAARGGGLHGMHASAAAPAPLRFILPADALA